MKKNLLLLLLLLSIPLISKSQNRIGMPTFRIRKEFKDPQYRLRAIHKDSDKLVIQVMWGHTPVHYYIHGDSICHACEIFPPDNYVMTLLQEKYDLEYISVRENFWQDQTDIDTLNIQYVERQNEPTYNSSIFWTVKPPKNSHKESHKAK